MKIKTANTIMTFPRGEEVIVYNYLSKAAIVCEHADLYWLAAAAEWKPIDSIVEAHPQFESDSLRQKIQSLIDTGIILQRGSAETEREADYTDNWELGKAAAMFHFTLNDCEFVSLEDSTQKQKARAHSDPSPDLFRLNNGHAISLPKRHKWTRDSLFDVMSRRRSVRQVLREPIKFGDLADCLHAGLGITGFVKTETSVLPLKLTPSGGARNPFEAYVWARHVEGLESGIYHYSALQHSIERVEKMTNSLPSEMLAGQDWADDMAAIIFLVADLKRTSWKYSDPNAYRVILIEAGHIAQNIMLACTANELTACPTAALAHSKISELLGIKALTTTPLYALAIGKPGINTDAYVSVESVLASASAAQHAMD